MGLARTLMAVVVVGLIGADPAFADSPVPAGFRIVSQTAMAPGVERLTLEREKTPLRVNVARIAPNAAVSLRAVLSNDAVAGPDPSLERTSSMCLRVHCLLAINGDFAGVDDQPLGGLLTGGELFRTPSPTQLQLSIGKDGNLAAGELSWSGTLVPTDLAPLNLSGVNVAPSPNALTLYTATYGPALDTPGPATLIGFRNIEPAGRLAVGQTTMVELLWEHQADGSSTPIPADGGVLVGQGSAVDVMRSLWSRVQGGQVSTRALLRLDTQAGVAESLGGSPILIRNGARWFADAANDFTRGRQPRTLVGWNPAGEKLLVTVDGRQPDTSVGMTLAEAADLSWRWGRPTASTSTAAGRPPSSTAARW